MVSDINQKLANSEYSLKTQAQAITAGTAIGMSAAAYTFIDTIKPVTPDIAKGMAYSMKRLLPEVDSFQNTVKTAETILEKSGLKSKGVKIHYVDDSVKSLTHLRDVLYKSFKNSSFKNTKIANYYEIFKAGANAAFCSEANEVIISTKNLYSSVYHELGHAMNANGNIFTKLLQKARCITPMGISLAAPVILAVGLLHKPNNRPNEEKSNKEKTLDFISKNACVLTLASYIPMLAEEGLASIRGIKHAKKFVSGSVLKNLKRNYTLAWGTYALAAVIAAVCVDVGIAVANKIKDKHSQK